MLPIESEHNGVLFVIRYSLSVNRFAAVIIERISNLCKRQNKSPRSKLQGDLLDRNHHFEVQCIVFGTLSCPRPTRRLCTIKKGNSPAREAGLLLPTTTTA